MPQCRSSVWCSISGFSCTACDNESPMCCRITLTVKAPYARPSMAYIQSLTSPGLIFTSFLQDSDCSCDMQNRSAGFSPISGHRIHGFTVPLAWFMLGSWYRDPPRSVGLCLGNHDLGATGDFRITGCCQHVWHGGGDYFAVGVDDRFADHHGSFARVLFQRRIA